MLLPVGITLAVLSLAAVAAISVVVSGHSHNDYLRARPLYDALDAGMASVEADVFLVGKQLMVAHTKGEIAAGRDLETMYLAPLERRLRANAGAVYPGCRQALILLIDIKEGGEDCYHALLKMLGSYPLLAEQKGVRFVFSGYRPIDTVVAAAGRYAAVDGRPEDLEKGFRPFDMPLVSESWSKFSRWKGTGPIPEADRGVIKRLAVRCHREGKKLRLWASPDTPESWRVQRELGVDLINTDNPAALSDFLR